MHYYDDDGKDKLSWSDIDKLRDGGKHREPKDQNREEEKSEKPKKISYAHKQYKKKLEEFFSIGKKKEVKVKNEELKKIKEIKSKSAYIKAADEYVAKNGFPRDLEFLFSFLEHKDSEKVAKSLELIEELYKEETETRQGIIKQKIHILEMTSSDPKIQGLAEEILARIKS